MVSASLAVSIGRKELNAVLAVTSEYMTALVYTVVHLSLQTILVTFIICPASKLEGKTLPRWEYICHSEWAYSHAIMLLTFKTVWKRVQLDHIVMLITGFDSLLQFDCCGVRNASEWMENNYLIPPRLVPDSCCVEEVEGCGLPDPVTGRVTQSIYIEVTVTI